jgi:predicted RecB family nuclease
MQHLGGRIVYSASDLNDFLSCEHLTALESCVLAGELARPDERPEQAKILARLGDEHERRYVGGLRDGGVEVIEIERPARPYGDRLAGIEEAARRTVEAMRAGSPAIYQATFFDGTWLGHADILERVDAPSDLGDWSYEVVDTKLARSAKPYFVVQLCFYSARVAAIQGRAPESMHVLLGDGTRRSFRVAEFAPFERLIERRLEERVSGRDGAAEPYPYKVSHCDLCVWDARCAARRAADDNLTEVAGLTRLQERKLRTAGVATLAQLGTDPPPQAPHTMKPVTFSKLARQARLQREQREALAGGAENPYCYELLPEDKEAQGPRGLALLPEPSPGDVFFDMEGDPFYDVAEGLEYLFGAYTFDGGFRAFWGCDRGRGPTHDRLAEKRGFESFVDFLMERLARDPRMHVYHYADYEKRALKSLAQLHATREDEVDVLLRGEVLVDLYRVVRQAVVVGQSGYGLKKIEALYGGRQAAAIATGGDSVVQFETWRVRRGDAAWDNDPSRDDILHQIEQYNEQDCRSTASLREWLLERRGDVERICGTAPAFYVGKTGDGRDESGKGPRVDEHADLKRRLRAAVPDVFDIAAPESAASPARPLWLALQLLDYYWREEKPVWWKFFDRCETYRENAELLLEDAEVIVGLEPDGDPTTRAKSRSRFYVFRFPSQEYKFEHGTAYDPITEKITGEVISLETGDDDCTLLMRRGRSHELQPLPSAIIIREYVSTDALQSALARFAEALLSPAAGDGAYRAAYDLLLAEKPRLRSRARGSRIQPDVLSDEALHALIADLDDSYLFVQGPPGSGKTYRGAGAIVRLLSQGRRVGVTAHSHKAINNILRDVDSIARERGVRFDGQRKSGSADTDYRSLGDGTQIDNITGAFVLREGGLYAGTAWAFAAADMDGTLDYLFVDEAGQMALPTALAAATSARNVVLLGDPLQLPHVRQTSHPGDVGSSVLEHLLGDDLRPVPPDRGILLDRTWRMHADVCRFISDLMYEGRLQPIESCNAQRVDSPGLSGTGIRYIEVDHGDARWRSIEEAGAIADQIELLLRGTVTEASGKRRPLEPSDIIVVTPYNAQRLCIEAQLRSRGGACATVAVGTVDKFQGQQAYVVFFSSAKSSLEDAPRGVEFIFDRNRLNVAISRARALAVYVGSPTLFEASPNSIARMRALAAGCALVEYGSAAPATA